MFNDYHEYMYTTYFIFKRGEAFELNERSFQVCMTFEHWLIYFSIFHPDIDKVIARHRYENGVRDVTFTRSGNLFIKTSSEWRETNEK